jgi:mercuric ion binding protein
LSEFLKVEDCITVEVCDATGDDQRHIVRLIKKIMKKIFFLAVLFITARVHAQVMQQNAQWATISIPQLKCWTCKERLENYLLQEKGPTGDAGIVKWVINMNAGTLRIQYVPDRITLDYIRTAINNAGFDADSTKAEPETYKTLPPLCKRKEDGGGPQKGKPCNIPPDQQ